MHKLIALVIALTAIAGATQRTPMATIPGPQGVPEGASPVVAAQNGILAVAYAQVGPEVYLYAIPNWSSPIATLTLSDPNAFINSIAIQNNYIAVAEDDPASRHPVAVYIFPKPESGWSSESETAILTPSNPSDDGFGAISVWGGTLLASGRDCAYIFLKPEGGWVNATENAQLTPSDNPQTFCCGVALTGNVGSGGSLAVIGATVGQDGYITAYVYVEPEGGWTSMTQTAELTSQRGTGDVAVSAAKSTIAIGSPILHGQQNEPYGGIDIYAEPGGGWTNSSTPTYIVSVPQNAYSIGGAATLTQSAQVLVSGYGFSNFKKGYQDLAYLWHADKEFGSSITLSAAGYTKSLEAATVTADYAFAWDIFGNIFIFDGK
ncbi:MAG TPA: hypothetical protein VF753_06160 [Terriglobales bacterium]